VILVITLLTFISRYIFYFRNLIPCDTSDNLADPYIKIYLLPDKSSSGKKKTQTIKNTLNPVWDET
jgi:synaptotagmin-like protein